MDSLIDLNGVEHHEAITEIVDLLCDKTSNTDRNFFQVEVAYFLSKVASSMRATIVTKDRGEIPVNSYVLALATSGFGKGHSVGIMEQELLKPFQKRFVEDTFPTVAETSLGSLATKRAVKNGTDQSEEQETAEAEFKRLGAFPFTFDSGTVPAVKQLRQKLLMAGCGSVNLQIDEIGSNLIGSTEVLTLFLELYDQGFVKQKLVKNTNDNQRHEELDGKTPTNMLLFGTPSKLFDGGQTEDQFYSFLETGYARRCLFGHGKHVHRAADQQSAEEIYKRLISPENHGVIKKWADHFWDLADPALFGWKMEVTDPVAIKLLEYKIACEHAADLMPEHDDIKKAEISHRYFKALKLAGAYAFIDESNEVEMGHLMSAILLVEESGNAFQEILNRERSYMKLAKYIASVPVEVTHTDLHESLPFYKSSKSAQDQMMMMATAWGYKQHIIIKKNFMDGIEFFKGESLKETDINRMTLSYSEHFAYHFGSEEAPFDKLHLMTQAEGLHWCNHRFKNEHRSEDNAIPGFNMVVIDVDEGITLQGVHDLMAQYKFMTYTTKRHQTEGHGDRFRLILPINYNLELTSDEYKEFMNSLLEWLPFTSDPSSEKREKKWETFHAGNYHYNLDGDLLDALPFIPKTSRNEQYKQQSKQLESLDNLERWFAQRIASGNRNNQMIKFAFALVDSGMDFVDITDKVHAFNKKLSNPLPEDELDSTILISVAKKLQEMSKH